MPSRSRSFMSRLRGRSRPAAKGRGRRSDGNRGGKEKRPNVGSGGGAASEGAGSPPPPAASPRAGGAAAPPKVGRHAPAENGSNSDPRRPAPQAAPLTAASNKGRAADCRVETTPVAQGPSPLGTPPTDTSRATTASEDFSDCGPDQFVTAFTRSPPSFDQFDSDILLGDTGVFPQPNVVSGSHDISGSFSVGSARDHSHSYGSYGQSVGHSHSNSCRSDGEPHSVGPHGILWGDSSVVHDGDESGSVHQGGVQDCFSGSADPPAILTDLNDDEGSESGGPATGNDRGDGTERLGKGGEGTACGPNEDQSWLESFASKEWKDDGPRDKDPRRSRLVSPSPAKPGADTSGGGDDLAAWGGATVADREKGGPRFPDASEDVFGSNFFRSGGFDDGDNGFGTVEDAFFGNAWMDVGNGSSDRKSGATNQSDPWGGASFADAPLPSASLNYSGSNEGLSRGGPPPLPEEKKDDDFRIGQGPAQKDGGPPSTAPAGASRVWDGQADGVPGAPSQAGRGAAPDLSRRHPLAAGPSSPRREAHEVVVTFDKSLANNAGRPSSIISERKVSHGSVPAAPRGHRRLNSKESSSSHRSQRPRRGPKGGGSVGSNSSAVDQILEHYRQKRRMKDRLGGRAAPGGASSVHSAQSVQSGSQFSSVAGTSVTNGAAGHGGGGSGRAGHRRIPSGGSSSHHRGHRRDPSNESGRAGHRRIPSGGSSSHHRGHRRNTSNESVSRIIDNLETAAAAADRGRAPPVAARAPSPAVGRYYPPSGNGRAGGGDDAADHQFLLANIEATIGPRGVAPDMESLSGWSVRSHRSQRASSNHRHRSSSSRPHRSPTRNGGRRTAGDASVDSRASRNSFRTYQSTRSALTAMSRETQSVANDLFRLEAQLAEVARQQEEEGRGGGAAAAAEGGTARPPSTRGVGGKPGGTLGADPVPRPTPFQVAAPPGKLGILLSNRSGQRGPTHVSAVRSESVLAGRVHVGDIFASIDGEDVTRMNSKEITAIMARKVDFERVLRFRPLVSSSPQEWI